MAKIRLNSLVEALRGTVDGIVFKRYGNKIFAAKYPDMSRVKRSAAQKQVNERMRWAARYYRLVLGDAVLKARYAKQAKAAGRTLHREVTRDYMRAAKEAGAVDVVASLEQARRTSKSVRPG